MEKMGTGQRKGFCVDDFTTEAMNFIDRAVKDEKPFFAYVPYNTPHSPMQVPDRWWNKFKDKKLEEMMRHRNPGRRIVFIYSRHWRCVKTSTGRWNGIRN